MPSHGALIGDTIHIHILKRNQIKRCFFKEGKSGVAEEKHPSERSEVTNRVVFGLITWFAGPGKSSREFVYIYLV